MEVERSFAAGDRVQFTRNERRGARVNGTTATVTAIDWEPGTMSVKKARRAEHTLQLDATRDRHVRHGTGDTVHGSRGGG